MQALLAPLLSHSSSKTVTATRAGAHPPQAAAPTACVLLPGVDRRQLAESASQLEAAAAAAHLAAQQLNKEGRYEEAKAKYAEMRRLDAEALDITRQLGCQQCMPDTPAAAAVTDDNSLQQGPADPAEQALFEQLHTPSPWPSQVTQAGDGEAAAGQDAASMAARARGCILGCLVCDAAATGVQWIYDLDTLQQLLQQRQQAAGAGGSVGLEFYEPVQSPFLSGYSSGRNSPYGEQTLLLLQSLAEQGGLDCAAYAQLYAQVYSGFEGYMNASTVAFLRTYGRGLRPPATGADDAQADAITRVAPLVAMFAGDPRLMQLAAAVTRVTQDTPTAVAWACAAAAVLERLVLGQEGSAAAAVQEVVLELRQEGQGRMPLDRQVALQVASQLDQVLQLQHTPHAAAVEAMGRNCHLPNSCQTPLHAVLYHEARLQQLQQGSSAAGVGSDEQQQQQQVFVAAVRDALAAGGCCASRAGFVGACLGALLGPQALPAEWRQKATAFTRVAAWAEAICSSRTG